MRLNVISWKRRKLVGAIALTFLVKFNLDRLVLIMTFKSCKLAAFEKSLRNTERSKLAPQTTQILYLTSNISMEESTHIV